MFLAPLVGAGLGTGLAVSGATGATMAAAIGLGTTAILGQGISSYQQGEYNAKVLRKEAEANAIAQAANESIQRRKIEAGLSRNRAIAGASGIEFAGSPLAVEINNLYEFEQELMAQRYNVNVQNMKLRSQATLSSMGGTAAFGTSLFKGAGFTVSNLLQEKSA